MDHELRQVLYLQQLLGLRDDAQLGQAITGAVRGNNRQRLQLILQRLQRLAAPLLSKGEVFCKPAPAMLKAMQGVPVAQDLYSGEWIRWDQYFKGAFLNGTIGSGKTNLVLNIIVNLFQQAGIRCWVFDRRNDYGVQLLRAIPQTVIIHLDEWRDNPLAPPRGVRPQDWHLTWAQYSRNVFKLDVPGETFLNKVLRILREQGRGPLLLAQMYDCMARMRGLNRDEAGYRNRACSRIETLLLQAEQTFGVRDSLFDILQGVAAPAVFVINTSHYIARYLITTLAWKVYHSHLANPKAAPLLFVLDEARYLIREDWQRKQNDQQDMDELATMLRPLASGFLFLEQISGEVSKPILSNSLLKVLLNNQAQDAYYAGRCAGLSELQIQQIPQLDPNKGECIIQMSAPQLPYPIRAKVPQYPWSTGRVTDQELRELGRAGVEGLKATAQELGLDIEPKQFLPNKIQPYKVQPHSANGQAEAGARLGATGSGPRRVAAQRQLPQPGPAVAVQQAGQAAPAARNSAPPLDGEALKLLLDINERPLLADGERGFEPNWLRRAKEQLARAGLIKVAVCHDGSHGAGLRLPQLTEAGARAIQQAGQVVKAPRNWIAHRRLAAQLQQQLGRAGLAVAAMEFHEANGNITDMVVEAGGRRGAVELQTTGSWKEAYTHLRRLVELYDRIVLVAGKTSLGQIRKGLKANLARDEWARWQQKLAWVELGKASSEIREIFKADGMEGGK